MLFNSVKILKHAHVSLVLTRNNAEPDVFVAYADKIYRHASVLSRVTGCDVVQGECPRIAT